MPLNDVVKITSITIKIGGETISVTMEEAKKLKDAMDEIFPASIEPIQIRYINEPYYVVNTPYRDYWTFGNMTTKGGTGGNTCSAVLSIEPEGNIIL